MDVFELSLEQGTPVSLTAFELNLLSIPPEITGKIIDLEKYLPVNKLVKTMVFRDLAFAEGILNVFSFLFEDGKCQVHFFGNMKGQEIKTEMEFKTDNLRNFDLLNEKIKFILTKSKNILRIYYQDSKIKNIEYHLAAFMNES